MIFFFKQKTAYEMRISDWSSDVCSSDLIAPHGLDVVVIVKRVDQLQQLARIASPDGDDRLRPPGELRAFRLAKRLFQRLCDFMERIHRRPYLMAFLGGLPEIGRASCRERVCQSVSISVSAIS